MSADLESRIEGFRDGRESSLTSVLQKAQAASASLQRLEEQMIALLEQRRKMMAELKGVQGQINDEFDRVFRAKAKNGNGEAGVNGSGTHNPVKVDVNTSSFSRVAAAVG